MFLLDVYFYQIGTWYIYDNHNPFILNWLNFSFMERLHSNFGITSCRDFLIIVWYGRKRKFWWIFQNNQLKVNIQKKMKIEILLLDIIFVESQSFLLSYTFFILLQIYEIFFSQFQTYNNANDWSHDHLIPQYFKCYWLPTLSGTLLDLSELFKRYSIPEDSGSICKQTANFSYQKYFICEWIYFYTNSNSWVCLVQSRSILWKAFFKTISKKDSSVIEHF